MKYVSMVLVIALAALCSSVSAQELSQRDQIHIAVQEICPVSGQKLGAHGAPIKARIGEETLFLCCQGCLKSKVDPKHWATIHANMARAQGKCPVMNKPLPRNAKWTIVGGQIVYVCCPGCIQKIKADPQTFLKKTDDMYVASLRARQNTRR